MLLSPLLQHHSLPPPFGMKPFNSDGLQALDTGIPGCLLLLMV